ncbi:MAG: hypothetical protein ACHRHE_14125, partial [Tepidisphaerales bacterium]
TEDEQLKIWQEGVDLIVQGDTILIRPNPDDMELTFRADEMLQELVRKRKIRFLFVRSDGVRSAIRHRGELWRIVPVASTKEQMQRAIRDARIAIGGRPIYYYNAISGTRWLTCQDFADLGRLRDDELRSHLVEIARYSAARNSRGNPEIDFFMAQDHFGPADFAAINFGALAGAELTAAFESLAHNFEAAVRPAFRTADPANDGWRNRMYCILSDHDDGAAADDVAPTLADEFLMRIAWEPGARLDGGKIIFDSAFEEPAVEADQLPTGRDEDVIRGLICNLTHAYGDLEYVNIGRVLESLSHRLPFQGRRDVLIAQVKQRSVDHESLQLIRMQKWGIRERLDRGEDLLRAILETADYTEYILDRHMACRQLGMNLPCRLHCNQLAERYYGEQKQYHGIAIWTTYLQRDYVAGTATDKIPAVMLRDERFSLALARLLGLAAAPNMVAGRCSPDGHVVFDDGDEILIEDAQGYPVDVVVTDHTGSFNDYLGDLRAAAPEYATPVTSRVQHLLNRGEFTRVYLDAFVERFEQIQADYAQRPQVFDKSFKHRRPDPAGNFAYRWQCVLARITSTRPRELAELIRHKIAETAGANSGPATSMAPGLP